MIAIVVEVLQAIVEVRMVHVHMLLKLRLHAVDKCVFGSKLACRTCSRAERFLILVTSKLLQLALCGDEDDAACTEGTARLRCGRP